MLLSANTYNTKYNAKAGTDTSMDTDYPRLSLLLLTVYMEH